jgi:hypothetical protein
LVDPFVSQRPGKGEGKDAWLKPGLWRRLKRNVCRTRRLGLAAESARQSGELKWIKIT